MKTIALTLAFLCTVVYVAQVDGVDSKSQSCNPYMFKDCCFMPQLISRDVFDQCLKEVGGKSKILFEKFKAKMSKKKAAERAAKKGTTVASPRGKRNAEDEDKTSPICMMNCVLEKQGMMKNGEVLVNQIKKNFSSKTNNTHWLPILDNAATKCSADLAKLKPSEIPSKPCSSKAAFFMTCIRCQLTINCPKEAKSPDYNKDSFCSSNRESLKTCDPFYVDSSVVNKQSAAVSKKSSKGKDKKGAAAGQAKKSGAAAPANNKNKKSAGFIRSTPNPPKTG